ncbi:MAG: hypothetical protein F7C35_00470 [Desulfurococcales archaeon]|nr:hypothetical protein [Desulfurococcales archaeon]
MEPEKVLERLVEAGSGWREEAAALVAQLPAHKLDELIEVVLAGLDDSETMLKAAARLASVPMVASSHPRLVQRLLEKIVDPDGVVEDIRDTVYSILENAAILIPPEDPNSTRLVEAILAWCPHEPRLCRLLPRYSGLIEDSRLADALLKLLVESQKSKPLEESVRILAELIDFNRLDGEQRQRLLKAFLSRVADGTLSTEGLEVLIEELGDRYSATIGETMQLISKLVKNDLELIPELLKRIEEVEDRLVGLLKEDPDREDVIEALKGLYKAILDRLKSTRPPCSLREEILRVVNKPLTRLRETEDWEIASLAARLFLEVRLGEKDYERIRRISEVLQEHAFYHPWVYVDVIPSQMKVFREIGLLGVDEFSYRYGHLDNPSRSVIVGLEGLKHVMMKKEIRIECYKKYFYDTIKLRFEEQDSVLILAALGFDKLEALTTILASEELPLGLERLAEERLSRLLDACERLGGCDTIPDRVPVMVRLGLAADMLVRRIINGLEVSRETVPLIGGALHQLALKSREPLKIAKVEPTLSDEDGCRTIWHGVTENRYTVYAISEKGKRCSKVDAIVCVRLEDLGEVCFDSKVIEAKSEHEES